MNDKFKFIILTVFLTFVTPYIMFKVLPTTYNIIMRQGLDKELSSRISSATNKRKNLSVEVAELDKFVFKNEGVKSINALLIDTVSQIAFRKKCTIKEINLLDNIQYSNLVLSVIKVELEGDYSSLLAMVYYLDYQFSLGKISSLTFYKSKFKKNEKQKLFLRIYLQNISYS